MAEAVGVLATATQLAGVCCSLLSLIRKIKGATATIKNYDHQLQELHFLSDSISQNPLLQTLEIELHTQALLSLIQKTGLKSLLQKRRFIRAWYLIQREQELTDTLTAVDRQKINLCLSIEHVQSKALHRIQTDISIMAARENITVQDTSETNEIPLYHGSQSSGPASPVNAAVVHVTPSQGVPSCNQFVMGNNIIFNGSTSEMYPADVGIHYNAHAGSNVMQRNGMQFVGPTKYLSQIKHRSIHHNATKEGYGDQFNGSELRGRGAPDGELDVASLDGIHHGPRHVNRPVESERSSRETPISSQINGSTLIIEE